MWETVDDRREERREFHNSITDPGSFHNAPKEEGDVGRLDAFVMATTPPPKNQTKNIKARKEGNYQKKKAPDKWEKKPRSFEQSGESERDRRQ
jgi:hypothetical protein